MLKNYILVALRQFSRHKLFSALNVFCLAVGISFCLLIGQYILHERRVNASLKNLHQQYFLNSDWKIKNFGPEITTVGPLAKSLKTNYPGLVADFYRFNPVTNVVSAGDRHFKEDVAIGDTNFVSMYGYKLLYGDPEHAFINSSSAVITENLAMKLFGQKDVLGKTLTFTNTTGKTQDYKVSAVLATVEPNSVHNFLTPTGYAMFIPFEGNAYYPGTVTGKTGTAEEDWSQIFTVSFIELQPNVKPERLNGPIKALLKLNTTQAINSNLTVRLKPVDAYYLQSNNAIVSRALSILSLVALSILLLAVINFVNIMVGTSSYRIREIGLRKVFGGRRKQLILQYLVESVVLTLFAAFLSVLLYGIFRPVFNDMLNTDLAPVYGFRLTELGALAGLVLIIGLLAGIYPAFILSGSEVISSVKGKLSSVEKGMWLKKSLLVLQFTIATGVLIFSMTLSKQVNYFFNKDLGYDKDQLLVITAFPKQWDSTGVAKMETIRDRMLTSSVVKDASVSFDIPERVSPNQFAVNPEGVRNSQSVTVQAISVDEKYGSTFGLHLLDGTFFRDRTGGFVSGSVVINESAMEAFGWKTGAGKKINFPGGGSVQVVGVIKDFHLASMHEEIRPLILFHVKDNRAYRYLTVKLRPGNLAASIEQVRVKWKEISPSAPFDFSFMDDKLQSMYKSEVELKKAAGIASGLMLLIVLLGIFGVLTLALTRRLKEIAVRKVLGAEIYHILGLFIKQYSGLLLIANLIAWPLTYYYSNQWLQQYAYRINQPLGMYLMAGIFVAAIAFILIVLQCLKAATANPVTSLRSE
jgi:putative ABC transport system permease protein